jgi:hypothetical protein
VHIALAELAPALPVPERDKVGKIIQLLRDTEDSLRDLSHELRRMVLENLACCRRCAFWPKSWRAETSFRSPSTAITMCAFRHQSSPWSIARLRKRLIMSSSTRARDRCGFACDAEHAG